jgi:phosphoribosyl 1,2-cyclic phosphodiesterase
MKMISLQSGSNGNSIYVEAGGVKLLIDAGISGKSAEGRLASNGIDIRDVDALLISHDHTDHISHSGIFQRKYGMPVHITKRSLAAAERRKNLGKLHTVCYFTPGVTLHFGSVSVETIPTAHDATEGVGFVVDDGSQRLGILTDLGHVFDGLSQCISTLDALFIESNYDPVMLERGPYPRHLKDRISGDRGHISNIECARLILDHGHDLKWACLGHLSQENNSPERAIKTHRNIVGQRVPIHIAGRYTASEVFEL